jgi:hypothetical protein
MAHGNFRQRCDKAKNVFDDSGLVDDPCVKFLWIGGGISCKDRRAVSTGELVVRSSIHFRFLRFPCLDHRIHIALC